MRPKRITRTVLTVVLGLVIFIPGISNGRAIGLPVPDTTPPKISHTPMKKISDGMPVRIQATVTDNDEISEVILNYRRDGDDAYRHARMLEAAGSNIYSVDLPDNFGQRIEYFIEANDNSGNTTKDESHEIAVPVMSAMHTDVVPLDIEEPGLKLRPEKHGVSKWVWIGVGVLAAGAMASGGGGGGSDNIVTSAGSSGNNGTSNSGTGVGIGTVTINAPVPQP